MVGPGLLETKIENPRHANRLRGVISRAIGAAKGKDKQILENEEETDYSREIVHHLGEAKRNLEKSEDDWLLKYENILTAYNHFKQAKSFMKADAGASDDELKTIKALIGAKTSQLVGPFISDLKTRSANDNLTGVSAIERFHAVYDLAAICNEISEKPQFGIPDLHRILYEHQVKSYMGSASDFIKHIALLAEASAKRINRLVNLAMNTSDIDITSQLENAGLSRKINSITRDDLRNAIIGYQKDETKFIFSKIEREVFYECNKDVDERVSNLLFRINEQALFGALLTLKDEKRPYTDLGEKVDVSGKDDVGAFYRRGDEKNTTPDEKAEAIDRANEMGIALGKSFVYNPRLTKIIISAMQVDENKPNPENDAALRLQLTKNLEPCRPKAEFTADERERIVDAAYEALTDYKSGIDALRECKNYSLMMLPRITLQKIAADRSVKTDMAMDIEKMEEKNSLTALLKENDSLVKKRLYVSTEEELSREKGTGSRLVERLISESGNKARNLMDIHDALYGMADDKKALKSISEIRTLEIAATNEKYNSVKLKENGNESREEQFRSRLAEIEGKLRNNSEIHEDSNGIGKLTKEKLSPLEELKTSFENGIRDIYTVYGKASVETGIGDGAKKIKDLIAGLQSNVAYLVKEYNTKIEDMRIEEKEQLKDSYMRMCEPEVGLDFTTLLINLKTIVEKMNYVADKQTNIADKVKSYQAINRLQKSIGKFVLAKYEENYKRTASMSERAFLEANRFYYKEIIGIKGTNGSMHVYNPEYERLFARLDMKEFRPLEELAKLERVLSGRLGDLETPLNSTRMEECKKETGDAFRS